MDDKTDYEMQKKNDSKKSDQVSPLQRFEKSMDIDYEKWHDGKGYE